jgi:hypothetical protein
VWEADVEEEEEEEEEALLRLPDFWVHVPVDLGHFFS